ncbi:MAG: Hsp20/alpha crystallin family protein [Alphaproteobacteria bacterium]
MRGDFTPFSGIPGFWRDYDYGPFADYRRDYDWSPFAGFKRDYDWSPFAGYRRDYEWSPFLGSRTPFTGFRKEIDRFVDDFFRTPAYSGYGYGGFPAKWPMLDFKETDDEVIVIAEVPGMTEKDVELYFDNGILTIRGWKKADKDEPGYTERFYGRFERQVPLPYSVDGEHCMAEFRDGLLSMRFKKLAEVENTKKIPIHPGRHVRKEGEQRRKPAFVGA